MHAVCFSFVFCVSDRIRVGRPGFDSAVSRFIFAATATLALNLIFSPTEIKIIRSELDEDQSSIASERLGKRRYLPSTFYISSRLVLSTITNLILIFLI
jgi:hypothetical protein